MELLENVDTLREIKESKEEDTIYESKEPVKVYENLIRDNYSYSRKKHFTESIKELKPIESFVKNESIQSGQYKNTNTQSIDSEPQMKLIETNQSI